MHRISAAVLLGVALVALPAMAACQPIDDPLTDDDDPSEGDDDGAEGAAGALPGSLEELFELTDVEARGWNTAAVVSDVKVRLDEDGEWVEAGATYVASGADEVLELDVQPDAEASDGVAVVGETMRLATLGLEPMPQEAAQGLPSPDGLAEPSEVAEAAVAPLEACEGSPPVAVARYTTGALAAWDEDGWSLEPRWRLTARGEEGVGVALDAQDAEPAGDDPCVPPPPEPDEDEPAEIDEDPGTGPLVEPPEE